MVRPAKLFLFRSKPGHLHGRFQDSLQGEHYTGQGGEPRHDR